MSADAAATPSFRELGLSEPLLAALDAVGYEAPSPIQASTIPVLLEGRDVLGQAQTGTGKTGAFALPLIQRLDLKRREPQVLVLAPTRELAIQVAEAFQRYASRCPGFHVLPVYGGQPYPAQVRSLKRGVHVVVGTPGRVMDHMRRGTLKLGGLQALVLDEADEMLAMGFLEDVTWILEQTPEQRQVALFSATMPNAIRRIVNQHLRDHVAIATEVRTKAADTIRQRHLVIHYGQKLDALTRLLEAEPVEGMLVFVRTKTETVNLAEKLEARGYATAALNGDIPQAQRERTVERFRQGRLDLLVATDVAARGLDVERISHVLNFDIPHDPEAYIHRIGRTGRAGRSGEAILFVTPRERRMLALIEGTVGHRIELMTAPSTDEINQRRVERFKQRISETREGQDTSFFERLIAEYVEETGATPIEAAAALAHMAQGNQPFLLVEPPKPKFDPAKRAGPKSGGRPGGPPGKRPDRPVAPGQHRYRIEVGFQHGVKPGQIMGAIANEGGLEGRHIGRIDIRDDHSLVDLPSGMPAEVYKALTRARVCGQRLAITKTRPRGPDKKRSERR
jgi:ATP-dependent RNA helicase DeaD